MVWLPLITAFAIDHGGVAGITTQTAPPEQAAAQNLDHPVQVDDVEVFGRRGAALTPPEIELDGADIDTLRAWNIDEVLQKMEETLGLSQPPLVLVNGRPTPNFSAYSGFPPDALVRAEVLAPEASGIYGANAGQRVVNLVLQPQFSSYDGRIVGARPTQGGASSLSGDLRRSAIAGRDTHQVALRLSRDTALRAGERDGYGGSQPDSAVVTIRPQTESAAVSFSATRALGEWSSVFSANAQKQESRAVVRYAAGIVETYRSSDGFTASAGASGQALGWFLHTNLSGRAAWNRERGLQELRNEAQAFTLTGSARRSFLELPAGALTANLNSRHVMSRSVGARDGVRIDNASQSQDTQALVSIPLSKADATSFPSRIIGDLAATLGAGVRQSGGGGGEEVRGGFHGGRAARFG